jgi:hypothetical protein
MSEQTRQCAHGHTTRKAGCVSCVLLFNHSGPRSTSVFQPPVGHSGPRSTSVFQPPVGHSGPRSTSVFQPPVGTATSDTLELRGYALWRLVETTTEGQRWECIVPDVRVIAERLIAMGAGAGS